MCLSTGNTFAEVRLIAIPPPNIPTHQLTDQCLAAVRGGVTSIQLRMKNEPASVVLAMARTLMDALPVPVYINDRADIARLAGARGVHIGADDLDPKSVRAVLPLPFRVGISVGNKQEATAALGAEVDYWSVGPFALTTSKIDAGASLGPDGFRALASLAPADMPLVAIGGINPDNAREAIGAGANGVAVISSLFGAPDVEVAARALWEAVGND